MMRSEFGRTSALMVAVLVLGTGAFAEGIASEAVNLEGLSDLDCVQGTDELIAEISAVDGYLRTVEGSYTRRVVFTDGTFDFLCFPEMVAITVYVESGGDEFAQSVLEDVLSGF